MTLFATLRDEPAERVVALLGALTRQDVAGPIELIVAIPPDEQHTARAVTAGWTRGPVVIVANPSGERSAGLNLAIDRASGDYAIRVDARSRPPADYVRRCVARLEADPSVGVVGGTQAVHVDSAAPVVARGIGRALRNRWLLGNASYRNPVAYGSVDTVYLGAFRTHELIRLRYDERLTANEDFDLCTRFRRTGLRIWLESGVHVPYEPRTGLDALYRQYRDFGRSKVRYWRLTGGRPSTRQRAAIAGGAMLAAVGLAGLRRPTIVGVGAAAMVATYLATDAATDPSSVQLATRLAAVPAHVAVEAGWLSGIAFGMLERCHRAPAGTRSGDVEHPL